MSAATSLTSLVEGATFITLPAGDKFPPRTGDTGKGVNVRLTSKARDALVTHGKHGESPNVGLLCGGARVEMPDGTWRGIGALDVDCKPARTNTEGKPFAAQEGPKTLAALEAELGSLPETLASITPSGGEHRLFWIPTDLDVSNKIGPGLEFQNDGQYIAFPGSSLDPEISERMGYIPGAYRWKDESVSIADLPLAWIERFRNPPSKKGREFTSEGEQGEWTPVPLGWARRERIKSAITYLTLTAPLSIRGQGGRDVAFRVAVVLTRIMRLPLDIAADLWEEHYNPRLLAAGTTAWARRECGPHGMCIEERLESAATTSSTPIKAAIDEHSLWEGLAEAEVIEGANDNEIAIGETAEKTELRNAERLVEVEGENLRHVGSWAKGLVWDGARWQQDEDGGWLRAAKSVARIMFEEAQAAAKPEIYQAFESAGKALQEAKDLQKFSNTQENRDEVAAALATLKKTEKEVDRVKADLAWASSSQNAKKLAATITLAQSDERVAITHKRLDRDPWLLNVQNGTIDLRNGMLQAHRREDLIMRLAPVAYDPEAESPTWDAFLARAMGGNTELVSYLQRLVGYALTGDVGEHLLVFLYGAGANGKSTFMSTLHAMLGDYATPAPRKLLFKSSGDRHPTELAALHGRRFVTCSEIEEGQTFDEALVKDLTGGDPIECRRMREDFWTFEPTHKLFIAGNHKPTVRGDDEGIWRRMRLVPWTVTIPKAERDTALPGKLRTELPGILAWAVRGCLAWQAQGLSDPAAVADATKAYRSENDLLGEFFASHCKIGDGKAPRHVLRAAYESFCRDAGAEPFGARRFTGRIRELGAKETTMRWVEPKGAKWENGIKYETGGSSKVVPAWTGIRLVTEEEKDKDLPKDEQSEPARQSRVDVPSEESLFNVERDAIGLRRAAAEAAQRR